MTRYSLDSRRSGDTPMLEQRCAISSICGSASYSTRIISRRGADHRISQSAELGSACAGRNAKRSAQLLCLACREGRHCTKVRFHYVSPNTDLMGWVIERAAANVMPILLVELLWRPMGAGRSAYITVDRLGAPRCAGGFCATTRDLARLGLLIAEGGRYAGKQIVPSCWIDDIMTAGDARAWDDWRFRQIFSADVDCTIAVNGTCCEAKCR